MREKTCVASSEKNHYFENRNNFKFVLFSASLDASQIFIKQMQIFNSFCTVKLHEMKTKDTSRALILIRT